MELNFRSDNESPAHARIVQAVIEANQGFSFAYAEDTQTDQLDAVFSDLFETPVSVLPLITGTVANSIALASVTPPWGSVYCHGNAHCLNDESGAPEFYGQGLRLVPVHSALGKLDPDSLDREITAHEGHGIHAHVPSAVTLTQASEAGTVYQAEQIREICQLAKSRNMACHMDGARFGNAVAALGCSPADITWRSGIDLMSFGATKNGCLGAEALIVFRPELISDAQERLRKRGGHLLSKMRYVSAQLIAYLERGLWLELAGHANQQAAKFASAVEAHPQASLEYPVDANEVFVRWTAEGFSQVEESGVRFLTWPGRDDLARFVFSHATTAAETDFLCRQFSGANAS